MQLLLKPNTGMTFYTMINLQHHQTNESKHNQQQFFQMFSTTLTTIQLLRYDILALLFIHKLHVFFLKSVAFLQKKHFRIMLSTLTVKNMPKKIDGEKGGRLLRHPKTTTVSTILIQSRIYSKVVQRHHFHQIMALATIPVDFYNQKRRAKHINIHFSFQVKKRDNVKYPNISNYV